MSTIYSYRESENLIFRENFTNANKAIENGWVFYGNPIVNKGITFDGISQYATIDGNLVNIFASKTNEFTMEIEFTPPWDYDDDEENYIIDSSTNRYFILKRNNANGNAILIRLNDSTVASIASDSYSDYWLPNQKNVIVVAAKSGNTDVYLNNHLISEANATAWVHDIPGDWYIGRYNASATYTDIHLCCLSMYGEKKEADWVEKRYNKTLFKELNLENFLLYLPLNAEYYNTGDSQYYTRDLASGEDPVLTASEPSDLGFSFNGTTSKIEYTGAYAGTGDITIGGKIYIDDWGELGAIDGFIYSQTNIILGLDNASSRLAFTNDGESTIVYSANDSIKLGGWYDVGVTRTSAGLVTFYINGEVSGTASQDAGTPSNVGVSVIGNNTGQTKSFDGFIRKMWIYDGIMTPEQIREINNKMDYNL